MPPLFIKFIEACLYGAAGVMMASGSDWMVVGSFALTALAWNLRFILGVES